MYKLRYLTIVVSALTLTACGGGSGGSSDNASNQAPSAKCDHGVLINSKLNTTSIFDQPLYQFDYDYNPNTSEGMINAFEAMRDGQMLYGQFMTVYNYPQGTENLFPDTLEQEHYYLNSSGLFKSTQLIKQNKGWPLGYVSAANDLTVTTSSINDTCHLSADKSTGSFEKVDLSGLRIADILPSDIATNYPKDSDYKYLLSGIGSILKDDPDALNAILNSDLRFPSGSIVYVPKSVIYDDNQFVFYGDTVTKYKSLDEWYEELYADSDYLYKKDKVAGYNVIYSIDQNGNAIYEGGADPAIQYNGKIYDGEWTVKGDILSKDYGAPTTNEFVNYSLPNEYTLFNRASFDFIKQQIQTYYK